MLEVAKIIEEVMLARGSLAKASILSRNKDNEKLKAVLKFIYDPYNKCCIGNAKLNKAMTIYTATGSTDPLLVIDFLTKHNTGSDLAVSFAAGFVKTIAHMYGDQHNATMFAVSLVTQNLKIGVAVKSLNNIFGKDFIPTVGCMLGTLYEDVRSVAWPCIITEKLDGIRRMLVKENGKVTMYSRSGHKDEGCIDILNEAKYLPDNYVYDGELLAAGTFADNIAWRQATSSIANSGGIKHGLTLNVFDMVPVDEFFAGKSKMNARARKILLGATLGDEGIQYLIKDWARILVAYGLEHKLEYIIPVPILGVATALGYVTPIVEGIWKNHGEGVMLNTCEGYYELKRSKHLLKVKHTEDKVLTIIDFTEGTGKYEGSVGAIIVDYNGTAVGVGSGLNDLTRQVLWDNQDAYVGKQIEVETFGESVNASGGVSLNCPIFKRFVGED